MQAQKLIYLYIVEDELPKQIELVEQLVSRFSLLEIVTQLEDSLTQEDEHVRAKATQCLADVVRSLGQLKPQEVSVLTVFLSDRLQDKFSIEPAVQGLENLALNNHLTTSPELWKKLRVLDMPMLDVDTRYKVFKFLKALSKHPNQDFVSCFIELAQGEKDPRNLMINLTICQSVLEKLGDSLPEDLRALLYDNAFCYFPIKFHPPRDMPYTITAAEIKEQLAATLASPHLAQWVIPGLISKLTAINMEVKVDSLTCLERVLSNLPDLETYWFPVYDGLKMEILQGTPQSETFGPIIRIFSNFITLPAFIDEILKELDTEGLSQSKLTQMCHIVIGICSKIEVWEVLVPKAVEKCLNHPEILSLFLKSPKFPVPHSDQVLQTFLQALANGNKREGVNGLKLLAQIPSGRDYIPLVVQTLSQEQAFAELEALAPNNSSALKEHALPILFTELPDTLYPLSQICCTRSLVDVFTDKLLSQLDLSDSEQSLELLQCLITSTNKLENADFVGYDQILVPMLFKKVADSKNLPPEVVDCACILLEKAGRGVTQDRHQEFVESVTKDIGKYPFHMILSCLAAMDKFPFKTQFVEEYAIPRLLQSTDILERAGYLRLIALIANKWCEDFDLASFNKKLEAEAAENLQMLEVWAWFTKGLINRADPKGFENTIKISEKAFCSTDVANIFGVIVATDRVLSKENGCTIRALFRQKIFSALLPKLVANPNSEALIILSSLLKFTPQIVINSHFDTILDMVTSSLDVNSTLLQENSLKSLLSSLPESSQTLQPHLHTLIPKLLGIGTTCQNASVRALAIQLIITLKKALPDYMNNFANEIIPGIVPALGDRKRDVRRLAVNCRQAFY